MSVAPSEVELPQSGERTSPDNPWLTIVWNDPINLMDYVTYVFQTVFGVHGAQRRDPARLRPVGHGFL